MNVVPLSDGQIEARLAEGTARRNRALAEWAKLLVAVGPASPLFLRLQNEGEVIDGTSVSLAASLVSRATATLEKRLGSLLLYQAWRAAEKLHGLSFGEPAVFAYLHSLTSGGAPPTRAQSAREAFHLASAMFELPLKPLMESARVRGVALQSLSKRKPLKQRDTLTVPMVEALERAVVDSKLCPSDRFYAGAAVFALFGRTRVGDFSRVAVDPRLDDASGDDSGFIDVPMRFHKTAKPSSHRELSITAPLRGVSGTAWARAWLALREDEKLSATCSGTLLPALSSSSGWAPVALRTREFGFVLRALLVKLGFEQQSVANVGAHSLKATTLSWAAKFGLSKDVRRDLGYHTCPADKSVAAYSRDAMAPALRLYSSMLRAVADRSFLPDLSRSGRFPKKTEPSLPSSSSSVSASRSVGSGTEGSVSEGQALEEEPLFGDLVLNKTNGVVHRTDETGCKLKCGRDFPVEADHLDAMPLEPRLCKMCF